MKLNQNNQRLQRTEIPKRKVRYSHNVRKGTAESGEEGSEHSSVRKWCDAEQKVRQDGCRVGWGRGLMMRQHRLERN